MRDLGDRRRPDRRDRRLSAPSAAEIDRLPRPACPAGRDRQPCAFPRARPDPQGRPGNRLARRGAWAASPAVFEMPNTDPLTTDAPRRWPTRSTRGASPHALRLRLLYRRHAREHRTSSPSWSGCPAARGVKVFMGSSTGSLLIEDDDGVRDILKAIRRRAAFHSEDEYRLRRAHAPARRGRSALASGLARRDRGADVHAAAGRARARDRQARARAARHDHGGDRLPRRPQGRRHRSRRRRTI